ncbi:MAG: aminoacyl-tRNA hydrolase [Planctomycetes bacterium]|nr:aminoacyl-tRNA hydrolase [Planctomycetota bacterium]
MKVILGVGNPGKQYARTRHNVGFEVAEAFAARHGLAFQTSKLKGLVALGEAAGEKVLVVKPTTFVNLSGNCLRAVMDFYKAPAGEVAVALDDAALPVGKIRLRCSGSHGGHNGLRSLIPASGGGEFLRLRIGVGDAGGADLADHVLGPFSRAERALVEEAVERAVDALLCWMRKGPAAAMNQFNPDPGEAAERAEAQKRKKEAWLARRKAAAGDANADIKAGEGETSPDDPAASGASSSAGPV